MVRKSLQLQEREIRLCVRHLLGMCCRTTYDNKNSPRWMPSDEMARGRSDGILAESMNIVGLNAYRL